MSSSSSRAARYRQITSIAQLREHRRALQGEILRSEQELQRDYDAVKHAFSPGAIISSVMERFDSLRTIFAQIYDGYRFVQSLFKRDDQRS